VPDPTKRHQIEEKMRWAEEQLAYYEREGLVLEAERLKQFLFVEAHGLLCVSTTSVLWLKRDAREEVVKDGCSI
jgi:hypothetical protein